MPDCRIVTGTTDTPYRLVMGAYGWEVRCSICGRWEHAIANGDTHGGPKWQRSVGI
jgi:hypothetical protein